MSGRPSRQKGQRGERQICKILSEYGFNAVRTPLSGGGHWKGDVHHPDGGPAIPGHHIEIKQQEKLAIPQWLRQTEGDCPDGMIPTLIFRQSRQPWRVILPLDEWLQSQFWGPVVQIEGEEDVIDN